MTTIPQNTVYDHYYSVAEYLASSPERPMGPFGPLGPSHVALIHLPGVAPVVGRTLTPHHTVTRPAKTNRGSLLFPAPRVTATNRSSSRTLTTEAPPPPKKCAGCGTVMANAWLMWNVCACGRVRPPTPREESARLRLRLAAAGA